uniref:Uncharacterized protein n=1 Tax=Leersia perrieri TaxID=77586 RepID=A0A0D9XS68_9ORYZ
MPRLAGDGEDAAAAPTACMAASMPTKQSRGAECRSAGRSERGTPRVRRAEVGGGGECGVRRRRPRVLRAPLTEILPKHSSVASLAEILPKHEREVEALTSNLQGPSNAACCSRT